MNSSNSVLKSLDWKRLLRKSSEEEYDSDETFCEEDNKNGLLSPEIFLSKETECNAEQSRMGSTPDNNDEKTIVNLLGDVEIGDAKVKYKTFFKQGSFYDIGKTKNSCSHIDVMHDNINVLDGQIHEMKNFSKVTSVNRQKLDERKLGDPFKNSDCGLDLEVNLSFLDDPTHKHNNDCFIPTLTLSNECQRIIEKSENDVLQTSKKRRGGKMTFLIKKKLPERKCASYFIKKSNRIRPADNISNTGVHFFTVEGTNTKINLFNKHKLNNPKKYSGKKRGRPPLRIMNGFITEKKEEEKVFGSSILQDLEEDLFQLKERLSQSIETREEAFQMLSHVQNITKTLKFHLNQAIGLNKGKHVKNQRKFLLHYLAEQIEKSEELERFLDEAISEADRLTELETGDEANKTGVLGDNADSGQRYDICKEERRIQTILRKTSSSEEMKKNSSEPRHISFSDEVECRYLTCSSQSSDGRKSGQSQEQEETGQKSGNNIQDLLDPHTRNFQSDLRKEEFEISNNLYNAGPNNFSPKNELSKTRTPIKCYENRPPLSTKRATTTESIDQENNKLHSLEFISRPSTSDERISIFQSDENKKNKQGMTTPQLRTNLRQFNTGSEREKSMLETNSNLITTLQNIQTKDVLKMRDTASVSGSDRTHSGSSELLLGSENSESLKLKSYRVSDRFEFDFETEGATSDIKGKKIAKSDLFESGNDVKLNVLGIQENDFETRDRESSSQSSRKNNASFEALKLENRECRVSDTECSFEFSELQSSLAESPGIPYWQLVTIMDVKSVRIKEPGEFIDLASLPEGAMESDDWYDFSSDDEE